MRFARAALAMLPLLLAAAGPAAAGWGVDPYGPHVAVCTAPGSQNDIQAVSDGAGGVIVAWADQRAGASTDLYAQRINAAGNPVWTANGLLVCGLSGVQDQPAMIPDGAGGAILVWSDTRNGVSRDLWAQRLNASGTKLWATNGVQVTGAGNDQDQPTIAADGSGGALVAWRDKRGLTSSDVYAQRLSSTGTLLWTNSGITLHGVPVTVAAGFQTGKIVADGTGGAIVAWGDSAAGNYDIRAQRLAAATGLEVWTAGGVAVTADASVQYFGDVMPDGAGGAIVVWPNYGAIHKQMGQRLDAGGNKVWYSNNVAITGVIDDQSNRYRAVPDGTGGLFGVDSFSGNPTATRTSAFGLSAWGAGTGMGTSGGWAPGVDLATDGAGGCVFVSVDQVGGLSAWRLDGAGANQWSSAGAPIERVVYPEEIALVATTDARFVVVWAAYAAGGTSDLHAERFDLEGVLGAPAPVITAVADVANDQGGQVKVSWDRSDRDADPLRAIVDYRLWRSVPASGPAAGPLAARRGTTDDPDEAAASGRLLIGPFAASGYAWELAGSQAAAVLPAYSLVAATTSDSIGGSNPRTAFMVEARAGTSLGSAHWFSEPDSGYSVDDLAPAQPAPFAAVFAPGAITLHWGPNGEADLAGYRVYRGADPGFPLDAGSFVGETTDTTLVDASGGGFYYKLVAVDVHGNVSPHALARLDGALDVPAPGAARALALAAPAPHPVRAGEGAMLRFNLPAAGHVRLRLYDAQGRERATLADGFREAGEHAVRLARGSAGLPAGVYFVRLDSASGSRVRKVAVTD